MIPIEREVPLTFRFNPPASATPLLDTVTALGSTPKFGVSSVPCPVPSPDWSVCDSFESHVSHLSRSTFSLVIVGEEAFAPHSVRLFESLLAGAVPIIASYSGKVDLPLSHVIDWRKAVLQIPLGRLPEVPFMVGNISPGQIFSLRRHGRFLLEQYFATRGRIVYSALESLRHQVGIPPKPYDQVTQRMYQIAQYFPPTLPQEANFLDEETKEEFTVLQDR